MRKERKHYTGEEKAAHLDGGTFWMRCPSRICVSERACCALKQYDYLDDTVFKSSTACGTTTFAATTGRPGTSQLKSAVAAAAPSNSAIMNPGTSVGRMPLKVSVADLERVTAGLAN